MLSTPISNTDWTAGIEPAAPPEKEHVERWIVYVRQIWCGGAGSGRVKKALADKLTITGTVSGSAPKSTVKTNGMETECKYKHGKKKFSYNSGDPGLLVLEGTRREMVGTSVDVDLRWFYNARDKKERNDSRTFTGVFPADQAVNEVRDKIIEVKGKTLATFHLRLRFKRKR